MQRSSFLAIKCFFVFFPFFAFSQSLQWKEVYPGIWKATAGIPETYNLIEASGAKPNIPALAQFPRVSFPVKKADIHLQLSDGKTFISLPVSNEEQLFGFGLQFQTVHQKGKVLELHVDHYGGKDNGRTHAPVPFYVSSSGYGVFINSARYIKVWAGSSMRKDSPAFPTPKDRTTDKTWSSRNPSNAVEILVPAPGVDIYLFAGPTALEAVRRFNLFQGGGCLPPRWGLGFTQRVMTASTADDVRKEVQSFEEKGFPLDFIGLEPGWQSRAYPGSFVWDSSRFPQPAAFVKEMLDRKIRLNLWMNPYVAPQAPFYREILPFTGSHTVWLGVVPDFTLNTARTIFFNHLNKNQLSIGVSGYKIDEVDGYDYYLWPDIARFPSGKSAEQMRQTYGLLMQRYSNDLFRQKNQRTYGLVRASNAGGASFPYVIYNDYYNHQDFITALINSSFSGVLWTPEVRASKTAEEWLRRFQTTIFSPMAMINAWSSGTKPWTYPEVAEEVKQAALLRMQMMPYWYTAFANYHFQGVPPIRSMNLEPGFSVAPLPANSKPVNLEENPYAEALNKEIKDQYMAGEFLLVAPIFAGQTSRQVVLPKGKWYDFYTGKLVGDGEIITVTAVLQQIPVFVKDGGIVPMMPARLHAPARGEKVDLIIRYYGDKEQTGYYLYDDDGETFDYEKGLYSWRKITVQKNSNNQWEGKVAEAEKNKPNSYGRIEIQFMTIK